MVCAHCGSESHRTGETVCAKYCTLCKEPGHRQKRAGCKFRVCNKCGASGHSASECTPCSECGSTTHKSALSVACAEHKCTNCQGTLEPKGHNRNDCPRMQGCSEQHAEAAPDRGVDFLVDVAAKHWGMNRNDPWYNTPIHIVPTHASTLQVLALS